ncbi:DUF3160 domain-containing protein [Polyangium sorediatum]|uniref:DUF3160 domain-containing protein n=1 Tax=Polyangium sorediatum TaxID=889274 RepID=A0ABT6P607_9BACT|nr:DUF3160 domain-containing protein [Polyangium sorediatum]MDI1436060.1 DUF3160 domain-containing protein [Polyangium sorediatum]
MRTPLLRLCSVPLLAVLATACFTTFEDQPRKPDGTAIPPTPMAPDQQAELDALLAEAQKSANMTAADFTNQYAVSFTNGLSYDPTQADGLPLIQASSLGLDADEMQKLQKNGFVISEKKKFPTFVYGYESIYALDLPLYVSADSILYAVHRSYDAILKAVELASLAPELKTLLESMRAELAAGGGSALGVEARADADLFTAVALSLLTDQAVPPVAGANESNIVALVDGAKAHQGMGETRLFGSDRLVDYSQFEPRGHYTDSPELERYFRAMMWLGRIDFRIVETQSDGSQLFQRRQLEGAYVLHALAQGEQQKRHSRIDNAIRSFVGESDYMTLPQLDKLLVDLGVADAAGLAGLDDAKIAQTVLQKGYGTQRISSHIMINGLGQGTLPLSSSFALFGQRYVVDSHVFSNVVYDRVQKGAVKRMMPNPLDVGFAALGNDQAGQLLLPELEQFKYAPDLHMMRVLVDAHPESFWNDNLYNRWLVSLRELSPNKTLEGDTAGLPGVAKTEAWGRRLMNTQFASWAELRHDTLLYAKQSYTGGASCQFPDAFVDPYPGFYARIAELAEHGSAMVGTLDLSSSAYLAQRLPEYFATLRDIAQKLGEMTKNEREGIPLTQEHLDFINQAVKVQMGCGDPEGATGWYANLFFDNFQSVQEDPTIADVHTQPTDEVGNPVGRVLHVGTGLPRLMVVTADPCGTPRAFVGLASSYFEKITSNFERMTDEEWAQGLQGATPADVPWMTDLVSR